MPRGASPKREREYQELKGQFKEEGRYKGREEEVASRIVNKQRRLYGETRGQHREEQEGKSPDRDLPVPHYRHRTKEQLTTRLKQLTRGEVMRLIEYEKHHKKRKTVLKEYDRALQCQVTPATLPRDIPAQG